MDIWNSFAGMAEVEVTSAEPEESIGALIGENIEVQNIRKRDDLTYSFLVPRNRCKTVREHCKKRGDTFRIRKNVGLYWAARKAASRPLLLVGSVLLLMMAIWLPSRVFFVRVDGNSSIPARKILAAAEDCGIVFGASRREVRSERVKNKLLSAVPELQWAGVNTSGCTAIVSVREKTEAEAEEKPEGISSIVASRDGYVVSSTSAAGNLLVRPGESVRKGQVLISAYTDCGLCIRAEQAEGEILAQTGRGLEAIMPSELVKKGRTTCVKRKYSLLVRKKRIFLWKDSGIWEGSCGRMYEEYYVTLPGGFQLPAAFCVESYTFCESSPIEIPQEEAERSLKSFAEVYLSRQMVAGKIHSELHSMKVEDGRYRLTGEYVCTEMIGTARQEQIGDTNGENS